MPSAKTLHTLVTPVRLAFNAWAIAAIDGMPSTLSAPRLAPVPIPSVYDTPGALQKRLHSPIRYCGKQHGNWIVFNEMTPEYAPLPGRKRGLASLAVRQ